MHNPFDMFLDEGILDEVLGRLKSGKEADVYLVRQGERTLAAKVYKDRSQRSFKNNADYKEGRGVRNSRTEWVDVKTGLSSGPLVEVFGMLKADDQIVARGSDEIRPDTEIRVREAVPARPPS